MAVKQEQKKEGAGMFDFVVILSDLDRRDFPEVLERAKFFLIMLKGKPELLDKHTLTTSLAKCDDLIAEGSTSSGVLAIYGYCLFFLNRLGEAEKILKSTADNDCCKKIASYFLLLLDASRGSKQTDFATELMDQIGESQNLEDEIHKKEKLLETMDCDLVTLNNLDQSKPMIIIVDGKEKAGFPIVETAKTSKACFNTHFQMLSSQGARNDIDNTILEELKITSKELWDADPQDVGAQAIYLWLKGLSDTSESFHTLDEKEVGLIEAVGCIEKCPFATSRDEVVGLLQKALILSVQAKPNLGANILHVRLAHTLGPKGLIPKGYV